MAQPFSLFFCHGKFFHVWVEGYSECSLIKAHRHVLMLLKGVNWILSGVQKTNLTSCSCCFWYVFNWKIIRLNSVVNYCVLEFYLGTIFISAIHVYHSDSSVVERERLWVWFLSASFQRRYKNCATCFLA